MEDRIITAGAVAAFRRHLLDRERGAATVEKYTGEVGRFAAFLQGAAVTRDAAARWKAHLLAAGYRPATINGKLTALDRFFTFQGWEECKVRHLKLQRRLFREEGRELTRAEYQRLLAAAEGTGRERLALLMEAICATGIRVSEVRYLTVEAARRGRADISLKGKVRTILLPNKLCRKLLHYAKQQKTVSGEIFLTKNGTGMGRRQIWGELKRLCRFAGVEPTKVFPHNLRHLFAVTFYRVCKDIVRLADVLGHSCIDTTRLYLVTSGTEQSRQIDRLGLIS